MSRRKRRKPHQQSKDRKDTNLRTRPVEDTSPRRNRFWLIGVLSFFLIAGLVVVFTLQFTSNSDSRNWTIPNPLAMEMEPAVRELIQRARMNVQRSPAMAQSWGRLGAVCDAHKLYDCAEAGYRTAHSLDPNNFKFTYLLARILERQEQGTEELIALYQESSRLASDYATIPYRLGEVLVGTGQLDAARDAYLRAVTIDDSFAAAHRGLGQVYISLRDHESAIQHLERAADLFPKDGMIYSSLARTYMAMGHREEAEIAQEKSRTLEHAIHVPDPVLDEVLSLTVSSVVCYDRAKLSVQRGQYDAAIRDLKVVEKARSNDPYVQVYLGFSYHQKGSLELARKHLYRALDIKPDLVSAHMELGQMLENEDRYDEAISRYRRAYKVKPNHAKVNKRLAAALVRNAEYAEAVTTFERVSDPRVLDAEAHMQWGNALRQTGMYEDALEHLHQAVQLNPKMADAFYHLGIVLEELGYQDEAVANFQQAVQIDPGHRANQKIP